MNQKGIIALTTLILITAILMFGAVTLLITSMDLGTSVRSTGSQVLTKLRSQSCLEEALSRLRTEPAFTGQLPVSFPAAYGSGYCHADVADHGSIPSYKVITITGFYYEFQYTETRTVDMSVEPIELVD